MKLPFFKKKTQNYDIEIHLLKHLFTFRFSYLFYLLKIIYLNVYLFKLLFKYNLISLSLFNYNVK